MEKTQIRIRGKHPGSAAVIRIKPSEKRRILPDPNHRR